MVVLSFVLGLLSCAEITPQEDPNDVMAKFDSTWNIYEKCEVADDGSITYKAVPWGGLVGTFLDHNMPVDLSSYESITFEFGSPTPVPTQVVVADRFKTWGREGITSLTCNFDGQNVSSVQKILLQAGDTCTLTVTDIYLTPKECTWESTCIWSGECRFGNWEGGFVVPADKFVDANEGDKLEFIYAADKSDPDVSYWLFKTIYNATESTLEGNYNEQNNWGCALVSSDATVYRFPLTANDAKNLREKGLFVNGYYINVERCNLLTRHYQEEEEEEEE